MQRKADLEEHAGGAVGLMIWFGLICILAGIHYSGLIIALIMIVFYILAIRSLWKLAGEMDEAGYIKAGEDCSSSLSGVFAAGDVRTKQLRQIVTAAADGANAVTSVERYLYQ